MRRPSLVQKRFLALSFVRYTYGVTQQDAVQHRQKGAQYGLEQARVLSENEKYQGALFHCHLAVEKMLKAQHIKEHDAIPPYTHDLIALAGMLQREWSEEEKEDLRFLSRFVIDARYADPPWAEEYATAENATHWITRAQYFLSLFQS